MSNKQVPRNYFTFKYIGLLKSPNFYFLSKKYLECQLKFIIKISDIFYEFLFVTCY